MSYTCVDRGSTACPCILMESGQCYTCTMIQYGRCDCSENWQGVCPYTEYVQNGRKSKPFAPVRQHRILEIKRYPPSLSVITLECDANTWPIYRREGAYCMIMWKDWFVPVSVLSCGNYRRGKGFVDFAINESGPKTKGILEESVEGGHLRIKGPFYGGLKMKAGGENKPLAIVAGKGLAIMPVINNIADLGGRMFSCYLDCAKLSEDFVEEYISDIEYNPVDFATDLEIVATKIKKDYELCREITGASPQVWLMVSPYYCEKLLELINIDYDNLVLANHSNLCCGEGVCGSCSYTDKNGITVKNCKCLFYESV